MRALILFVVPSLIIGGLSVFVYFHWSCSRAISDAQELLNEFWDEAFDRAEAAAVGISVTDVDPADVTEEQLSDDAIDTMIDWLERVREERASAHVQAILELDGILGLDSSFRTGKRPGGKK
jgi:hypothetical protein